MIDFENLPQKQKNLLIAVILVIVFIFDFMVILRPQFIILSKLSKKASLTAKNLKNTRKDIASRKDMENKLTQLKASIADFGSAITPEEELPAILEGISRIANRNFVKITQIKPLKEEKSVLLKSEAGIYYQVPILLDCQCGYHSLGKFLNELESGPVLMKLVALEIAANQQDEAHHLVRMTLQTYVTGK